MSETPRPDNDATAPGSTRAAADARAAAFGRIMALLMASPRHAGLSLADANKVLTPAIAHGQITILGAVNSEDSAAPLAAAVWWALVSPEVDKRLTESRDAHLLLDAAEWRSGDQPWIIDTVGEPKVVNELLKRLAEHAFTGKPAKLRAKLPDGRMAVGRIERKPPDPAKTKV